MKNIILLFLFFFSTFAYAQRVLPSIDTNLLRRENILFHQHVSPLKESLDSTTFSTQTKTASKKDSIRYPNFFQKEISPYAESGELIKKSVLNLATAAIIMTAGCVLETAIGIKMSNLPPDQFAKDKDTYILALAAIGVASFAGTLHFCIESAHNMYLAGIKMEKVRFTVTGISVEL